MRKLLKQWLKSIAVSSLLFVAVLSYATEQDPDSAARSSHSQYREAAGSEKTLKQNFINPLLGGDRLYTIDRTKSGEVQLVCPSSKEFLTVLIRPKATGDFDADIYWDSDMDGKMDRSMTVSNVSGICTNGFISCNPGTWVSCRPYRFSLNQDGNMEVLEVHWSDLSGCFCVNQSCGSNILWNNLSYVLKLFGGAVAGTFQQIDSRYTVSDARIDGAAIYFYGQRTRDCSVAQGGSGSFYPEQYFKSPQRIPSEVENIVYAQSSDPNSFYSMITTASLNSQSLSNLNTCQVNRQLICPPDSLTATVSEQNYCDIYEQSSDCQLRNKSVDNVPVIQNFSRTGLTPLKICQTLTCRGECQNDPRCIPGSSVYVSFATDLGKCNSYSWIQATCNEDGLSWTWTSPGGTYVTGLYFNSYMGSVPSSCCGSPHPIYVSASSTAGGIAYYLNRYDPCDGRYEPYGTLFVLTFPFICSVTNEAYDNLEQCTNGCTKETTICGYWHEERQYQCQTQLASLEGARRRLATVVPSSQYSQGEISFTDVRNIDGVWQTFPGQRFVVGGGQPGEDCEKACRVKASPAGVATGLSGPTSTFNVQTNSSNVYYYRPCYNDTCPVREGETVDIPCQCMNDFGAASTLMQTMRLAGQDMICTSGNIKTLPGY